MTYCGKRELVSEFPGVYRHELCAWVRVRCSHPWLRPRVTVRPLATFRHTFLGGSIAMASFCGMDILAAARALAESCLSLLIDLRNCPHQYCQHALSFLALPGALAERFPPKPTFMMLHGCRRAGKASLKAICGRARSRRRTWARWAEGAWEQQQGNMSASVGARWE